MRFVSNSAKLNLGNFRNQKLAITPAEVVVVNGVSRAVQSEPYVVREAVPIQFSQLGLLQPDIAAALAQWTTWSGNTLEGDEVTPSSPIERIGVWDSLEWQAQHGLTDEERVQGENMLLNSGFYGSHFVKVEAVRAPAPWNTYDNIHHSKLAGLAAELGCVTEALAYERDNKNRPTVIAALNERLALPSEVPQGETVLA